LAYQLDWLPKGFEQKVKRIMKTQELTIDDFERRLCVFESLYNECVDKMVSDKILPRNLYRYFLSKSDDYAIKPTAGKSQTVNPRARK
jgi:hypothetical protein